MSHREALELLDILSLETIDTNLFRGQNDSIHKMRLFGGQVLAQAIAAANQTVDESRLCHSAHGYFLRPGRSEVPVVYQIERIRDGRSFTTRRIVAVQNGEAIFSMDASSQAFETGLDHQIQAPEVAQPEELVDDVIVARQRGATNPWMLRERPFEIRSVAQLGNPEAERNENPVWIRFRESVPDVGTFHQQLLAYASDMGFVGTSFLPHQQQLDRDNLQMASLDHALWFHQEADVTDWILFHKECTNTDAARGFIRGAFYNRQGQLVASAMQEGLIRVRG